jgi:hypothetical protein
VVIRRDPPVGPRPLSLPLRTDLHARPEAATHGDRDRWRRCGRAPDHRIGHDRAHTRQKITYLREAIEKPKAKGSRSLAKKKSATDGKKKSATDGK